MLDVMSMYVKNVTITPGLPYNTSAVNYYYGAFVLGSITIAYIIMTMHDIVFSMNIPGGDECSGARCITFWRRPLVPPTSGHL